MHFFARCLLILLAVLSTVTLPAAALAAPPAQQSSVPVYGVQGRFATGSSPDFPELFVTEDGQRFTVAGVNATVAQQISVLAKQNPQPMVKVWGTRNFDPKPVYTADLVVAEVLPQGDQAQPPANPTGSTATDVAAVVNFNLVNLYSTPAQSMAVVGQARAGEKCNVEGRAASASWLLVDCGNARGWIDRRLVNVTGSLDAVAVVNTAVVPNPPAGPTSPTPTPPPATPPASFQGWKVTYYNNATLDGAPLAYQDVPDINFNWGYGSPTPAVPVDYFTARMERTYSFPAGYYKLNVTVDDGVRVYVDNDLAINEWRQATGNLYTATRYLTGVHALRIDYLELVGAASIRFSFEYSATAPPWQASYYEGAPNRGRQLYGQSEFAGAIQLERTWGSASPVPSVLPAEGWNARWVGQFDFNAGNFIFRARADDGVRVYLNDTLVINGWTDGPHDISNTFRGVGTGRHTITIDYYDRTGYAYIQVFWYADAFGPNYVP